MTNDTLFSPKREVTTKRLARKFKVKTASIHHAYWLKGHFHGWEPTGHSVNSHEYGVALCRRRVLMASVSIDLRRPDKSMVRITAEYRVRCEGYSFKVHTKVYNGSKWRCPVRLSHAQQCKLNNMLRDERNAYLRELYAPFITEDELQFAFAKLKEQMS